VLSQLNKQLEKMKHSSTITRFPWRFSFLNVLIYFFARLDIIGIMYSGNVSIIPLKAFIATVPTTILIVISLVYQVVAYKLLKYVTRRKLVYAVIFLLPGGVFGSYYLYWSLPMVEAQTILEDAELAPLPQSATAVRAFSWSTGFSGCMFLRFRAISIDIEAFLSTSPILRKVECQKYSKDRMRLATQDDYHNKRKYDEDANDYFQSDWSAPSWYIGELKGSGRRYIIVPKKYGHAGEVIINEEENIVFVKLGLG